MLGIQQGNGRLCNSKGATLKRRVIKIHAAKIHANYIEFKFRSKEFICVVCQVIGQK